MIVSLNCHQSYKYHLPNSLLVIGQANIIEILREAGPQVRRLYYLNSCVVFSDCHF
jgi:hypothetical protein